MNTKPGQRAQAGRGGARVSSVRRLPFPDMAARRQQRLVNLVLCLLSTRQFITADRIRDTVEGYEVSGDSANPEEAFKRSFERDKAELRDLGIPLETGRNSAFDNEDGYRIARKDFELPLISFTADEAAAVGLAARLWSTASLATEARTALIKLRAAGVDIEEPSGADTLPALPANEPALPGLVAAVSARRIVQFSHRKPHADAAEKRTVEPWGVLSWRGRWYVVGHDRKRNEVRSFRLDRIDGEVKVIAGIAETSRPDGLDMLELVRGANQQPGQLARIRVKPGRAGQLRRMAREVLTDEASVEDVVIIDYRDADWLSALVAAAGSDVVVLEPPALIKSVVAILEAAAGGSR
ncbi:MAG: YafY family transcriptional regulator [Frankiales bacterium]|nr:YafY family transcriptional regulator [Frankiales bacterium]